MYYYNAGKVPKAKKTSYDIILLHDRYAPETCIGEYPIKWGTWTYLLVNTKLHKAVSLRSSMEGDITRPEKHVIAVSVFPVLEDRARVVVALDDLIGKHAKLIQF